MKNSVFRDLVLLVGFFTAVWLVFVYVPIFPDVEVELSIEQEEQLGELIVENLLVVEGGYEELRHDSVDIIMQQLNRRLLDEVGLTDYNYRIVVLKSEEVNAITLPGGHIFVFTGLIEFTETPEELAAVIAHEIGHVEKRHVVHKLLKEFTIELVFGVLTGGDMTLLGEIVKTSVGTVFDRRQEQEADAYALDLLTKAAISPRSMAAFFRRLSREHGGYGEALELVMTHPHHNSRIKAAMEYELPTDFKAEPLPVDWKAFKALLKEI
jgi:predicted Zn-dependent protease